MNEASGITARVAEYACSLRINDLPDSVVRRAKDVILDALGCQLACTQLPHGQIAIEFARSMRGPPEATVIGSDFKTGMEHAALVNGIQGHGDEIDDSLYPFGHASAVLVPTVLAVGERHRLPGRELLVALVVGYDLAGRLARAGLGLEQLAPRNFQQGSTAGSLAAAAAAGHLLGLSPTRMQAALGLAAEQACGLRAMRNESGHMNKSVHMGVGARNGITAAYLAAVGYGGVFTVLESPHSVFDAFVPNQSFPDELTDGLGEEFEIMQTGFKRYASGRPTHCAIAALLGLMGEEGLAAGDIASIVVRVPTTEHGQLSHSKTANTNLEYVLAVAAIDRQVFWEQYSDERQADPIVRDLVERITAEPDSELDEIKREHRGARPADVTVRTADGRKLRRRLLFPPGHPQNPLRADELREKFGYWAGRVIPAAQVARLEGMIEHLDGLDDANELGALLRIP